MILQALSQSFTVCKVKDAAMVSLREPFCFVGVTDGEISLVCQTERAPDGALAREDGWRAFRVAGSMAFSLVGVLARLTGLLADHGIAVFTVSTFDTDYVFTKADRFDEALRALEADGYALERG